MTRISSWTVDWRYASIMHGEVSATTPSALLTLKLLAISFLASIEKVPMISDCCTSVLIFNIKSAGGMVVAPREFVQSGPIFLDELRCTESDTTLQGCSRGIAGIGLTTCSHRDDVWVQCPGTVFH